MRNLSLKRWYVAAAIGTGALASAAIAKNWTSWGTAAAVTALNTTSLEGCPNFSPDGESLYFASNRSGGVGGIDIWVSHRTASGGWGAPTNLGAPINSAQDDFCPTAVPGQRLYFVSKRPPFTDGDIYVAKSGKSGWQTPVRLSTNINSSLEEASPSYYEDEQGRPVLYFSRIQSGLHKIYYSVDWAPATLAPGVVNSTSSGFSDGRPNVSKDGLEIVWESTRTGTLGGSDIWRATRSSTDDQWVNAEHLGTAVNTAANEGRPGMSRDGSMLVFHRSAGLGGSLDLYVSTRSKITGSGG